MLQKKYRLKNYSAFIATYRQNNAISDKTVCIYFGKKSTDDKIVPRVAFVVGKKIHKRAVVRNRIKRLMRENFRKGSDKMSQLFKEGKVFTVWQPEYWLRQGYSEKEAKDIIYSKMAHNSIEYFVGKYGEKEGIERYNARMKKFLETWNSKSDDELADIYKRRTKVPHKTSKASKTFFENCMETLYKEYNITLDKVFYDDNEYYLYDKENKSLYFYDFCDIENKIIVEYNGYKFHPYKNVQGDDLKNWRSLFFGIEGEYQRKRDFDKQKLAESMGFKYLVVWDIEDPQLSLNNFLKLYLSNKPI